MVTVCVDSLPSFILLWNASSLPRGLSGTIWIRDGMVLRNGSASKLTFMAPNGCKIVRYWNRHMFHSEYIVSYMIMSIAATLSDT